MKRASATGLVLGGTVGVVLSLLMICGVTPWLSIWALPGGMVATVLGFVRLDSPPLGQAAHIVAHAVFFAANALFYAAIFGWVFHLPRQKTPGHCQECRYDLTGNLSGVCPECGTKIETP